MKPKRFDFAYSGLPITSHSAEISQKRQNFLFENALEISLTSQNQPILFQTVGSPVLFHHGQIYFGQCSRRDLSISMYCDA